MEKRRLTERRIESLSFDPSGSTRQFGWDTDVPGFGVRLYQSGRKCYVLQYWLTGRRRLMQLGEAGVMPLEQARELARAARAKVNQDIDPLMERTTARQERAEAGTLSELIDAFLLENEGRWSDAHARETRRRLTGPVRQAIGSLPPTQVGRADINRLHAVITKRGAPVEANRIKTLLHAMFEWAADFGYVPEDHPNPAKGRRRSSGRNPERTRERVLEREEATELLKAADETGNIQDGVILRLFLLTALRRSELLQRHWSDVSFEDCTLTIPKTKNGTSHTVPLSDRAIQLFRSLPHPIDPNAPIFPAFKGSSKEGIVDWKRPWQRIRKAAGVKDIKVHDLRRTTASWLGRSGVTEVTIAGLLNHTLRGVPAVTAIYLRPMDDPIREAVDKMAELLSEVEPVGLQRSAINA